MQLTYLGTNTLVLIKGLSTLIIDPHFSRPRFLKLLSKIKPDRNQILNGLKFARVKELKGVLLTHTHYDHALDAVAVLKHAGGCVYGSESASNLAKGGGLSQSQYHAVTPGKLYQVGAFQVRFHPAQHLPFPLVMRGLMPETAKISEPFSPPAWFWDYHPGEVSAIQIDHTLVFRSAGFIPGAYQDLDVDTVILSIGGLDTKSHAYLEQFYRETVLSTGAEQVLISHWDNFFYPLNQGLKPLGLVKHTINRITALGNDHGQIVKTLIYGEPYML
jgi:L-ascorbate metabolism protein UlaG (beta-lactamase superfamily)